MCPSKAKWALLRRQTTNLRGASFKEKELKYPPKPRLCACGCGCLASGRWNWRTKRYIRYISGHNARGQSRPKSDEHRMKLSLSLINYNKNHENPFKDKKHTPETRRKISVGVRRGTKGKPHPKGMSGKKHTPESRQKMSEARTGRSFSEDHKRNLSEAHSVPRIAKIHSDNMRRLRQDPKFVERSARTGYENFKKVGWLARHGVPNKSEKSLLEILDGIIPSEFVFNDGLFILDGCIPDFVNVNGQKKLIEFFGSYWHNEDDEEQRVEKFQKAGWQTLVVWDYELALKNRSDLIRKIKNFIN